MRLLFLALLGCGEKDDSAGEAATLSWYTHPCGNGDPVSRECAEGVAPVDIPDPDWPTCAALGSSEGDGCTADGDRCVLVAASGCEDDPGTPINSATYLWCQEEPFVDQECPQSTEGAKEGIRYLEAADRQSIAAEVLDLRFARYRYRPDASSDRSEQLGMIIEDAPDAVFIDGQRINLYAYASALAVTVQEQSARLAELEARLEAVEGCQEVSGVR